MIFAKDIQMNNTKIAVIWTDGNSDYYFYQGDNI